MLSHNGQQWGHWHGGEFFPLKLGKCPKCKRSAVNEPTAKPKTWEEAVNDVSV